MLTAFDIDARRDFSLPFDTTEPRTVFTLRVLGIRERNYIAIMSGAVSRSANGLNPLLASGPLWTLRFGIVDWKNLVGPSGQPVIPEKESILVAGEAVEVLTAETIQRHINPEWVGELTQAIMNLSTIDGETEKN